MRPLHLYVACRPEEAQVYHLEEIPMHRRNKVQKQLVDAQRVYSTQNFLPGLLTQRGRLQWHAPFGKGLLTQRGRLQWHGPFSKSLPTQRGRSQWHVLV